MGTEVSVIWRSGTLSADCAAVSRALGGELQALGRAAGALAGAEGGASGLAAYLATQWGSSLWSYLRRRDCAGARVCAGCLGCRPPSASA
eukprot:1352172-Pyramimonas_sp.AAC.1